MPVTFFSQDSGKYWVYSANTHRCMGVTFISYFICSTFYFALKVCGIMLLIQSNLLCSCSLFIFKRECQTDLYYLSSEPLVGPGLKSLPILTGFVVEYDVERRLPSLPGDTNRWNDRLHGRLRRLRSAAQSKTRIILAFSPTAMTGYWIINFVTYNYFEKSCQVKPRVLRRREWIMISFTW